MTGIRSWIVSIISLAAHVTMVKPLAGFRIAPYLPQSGKGKRLSALQLLGSKRGIEMLGSLLGSKHFKI